VLGNTLEPGSIIATFEGGRYPNRRGHHAAIYIEQDENGIWVWDQWVGKAVHKRLIRWRDDSAPASNTAQAYRVVTIDEFLTIASFTISACAGTTDSSDLRILRLFFISMLFLFT